MNKKYEYMLNMPHHKSKTRRPMDITDRAAQFGAFRALTGYEDAISETGRLTDSKSELDDYVKEEIDRKLRFLYDNMDKRYDVTITCFIPDEKKSGGKYCQKRGVIVKFLEDERAVVLDNGEKIASDEIYDIDGMFGENEF